MSFEILPIITIVTPNIDQWLRPFALDASFDRADRITALLTRPEVARDLRPQAAEAKTLTNNGADDE